MYHLKIKRISNTLKCIVPKIKQIVLAVFCRLSAYLNRVRKFAFPAGILQLVKFSPSDTVLLKSRLAILIKAFIIRHAKPILTAVVKSQKSFIAINKFLELKWI